MKKVAEDYLPIRIGVCSRIEGFITEQRHDLQQ